jgi:peptidyl-prolyl cis-trans isomerase D
MMPADSVKIGATEMRAYYDTHKDRFRQEEQVHARHLLIMSRNAGAADEAKARARADSLLKAVKAGADFVDLCRRFSQEPGAAVSGGDLGWFGRGRMVREFETAAFALQPGELSDVVKTQFGFHIIRLEERKPAGIRTYDEASDEIRTELAQARRDTTARRAAQALRRKLVLGADAATAAKPFGGVTSTPPFGANESVPEIGFVQGLAADLPRLAIGKWAPTTYRGSDGFVLVRVRQKVPPRAAEFDEVKTQVVDDMKAAKKQELLERKVAAIRAALAAGAAPDSVAAPWGGLREAAPVAANAVFVPTLGFGPHIMPKILKLKPGELSDTLSTPLGVMWARFDQRVDADPATFKTQREQIRQEMLIDRMNQWLEQAKKTVRIDVLRADLREPKPGPYKTVTIGGGGG